MSTLPDRIDVLVVGAGLFGSVIARHLTRQGRTVTMVDAEFSMSGSKPAACIMRPSWLTKMTKTEQATAMATLDENFGVHEIEAYVGAMGLGKRTTVFWCAPAAILKPDRYIKQNVSAIGHDVGNPWFTVWQDSGHQSERHYPNLIIVAAGIWSNSLRDAEIVPNLSEQAGVAFTWPCDEAQETRATIEPWAPYKQLVRLPNRYPGELWVSDGTALKQLDLAREQACLRRCANWVQRDPAEAQAIVGLRPYIRGLKGPAFVEHVLPNIWVATGGAKNGTAGAGWAAYKLAEATN